MSHPTARFVAAAALIVTCLAPAAQAQSTSKRAEQLHTNAVASFQQARFPEAYGRFIALADAGHAPAAEMALFMARNAMAVFGKDWDVTQEQLTAWSALTGRPVPVLQARSYPRNVLSAALRTR